jgi:glycosyltransferase involved in cell wall biosynthesis
MHVFYSATGSLGSSNRRTVLHDLVQWKTQMKILLGTDTYYPNVNGASYFTQRLATELERYGETVHVICPSQNRQATISWHEDVLINGIPSLTIPLYSALRFSPLPIVYEQILSAVEQFNPDVIHIQDHFFIGRALTSIARRLNIPIIATNHFIPENLTAQLWFLTKNARRVVDHFIWNDLRTVYNRVGLITTPSTIGAQILKHNGISGLVSVVSCGVDLEVFMPRQKADPFRNKYELKSLPTYMYVGRLDREKQIDQLIRALPLVRRVVDAQLVIIGKGKQFSALSALVKREGVVDRVIFTGFIPDDELPHAYAACDVFCIAGTAELQSIATLESMASGKPVIAANAMALPHLVRDGINGYTFRPGDVQTLAARLIDLLTSRTKCEAMGQRSLEAAAPHQMRNTFDAFKCLYEMVINREDSLSRVA